MAAKPGPDVVWTPLNGFCGIGDEPQSLNEIYTDERGVMYRENGWPIMVQPDIPIQSREDWEKYKLPAVDTLSRLKILNAAIQATTANQPSQRVS